MQQPKYEEQQLSRRSVLALGPSVAAAPFLVPLSVNALDFKDSKTGLQYADAKVGNGQPFKPGSTATIDYVLSTTGAR
jgi:hypothetical protein